MTVDIFKEGYDMNASWMKFDKVGDKIQGTYVDRFDHMDKFGPCTVYVLKKEDGSLWNVSIKNSKFPLIDQMSKISMGQIVGISFDGMMKMKDGKQDAKTLTIRARADIVDQIWLDARNALQKEQVSTPVTMQIDSLPENSTTVESEGITVTSIPEATEDEIVVDSNPFGDTPATITEVKALTDPEKIQKIVELAKTRLGVKEASGVKDAVTAATKLALLPSNLDQIILSLELLPEAV